MKSGLVWLLVGSTFAAIAFWGLVSSPSGQVFPAGVNLGSGPGLPALAKGSIAACSIFPMATGQAPLTKDGKPPASEEILHQAETAFEAGRLEEALQKCQEAIQLDHTSAHAYYLLGVIQAERGAEEEAKQALIQSVKLDPSRLASHVYLARFYLAAKEWRAAEREFQAGIKLGDSSGTARYGLALALLAEARPSEALPHLLAAVEADSKDPERLITLMGAELQLKQADQARKHLRQFEKLSPRDPWLYYRVGKLLLERGMSKEAEVEIDRAAANLAEARGSLPPPDLKLPDFYLDVAQVRFNQYDYFEAIEYLNKIAPGSIAPNLQATALHLEGAVSLALGKFPEARDKLREATQRDPSKPDVYVRWIWAEQQAGDTQAARAAAGVARSKWPEDPKVQQMVALVTRESAPERARVPFGKQWQLKGKGLVCCPCAVPCPCRSNAPPTYGHCENTGVFRVTQGHYGSIPLDGFIFAMISGCMGPESIPSTLYVNSPATDEQIVALERLIQSFNPLRPFLFLNVKRAEISVINSEEEESYEVKIPAVLQIKIRRQLDGKGAPLFPTAALDYFSDTIEYARNLIYKAWDEGGSLRWDYSGRQANFRMIDLDSGEYKNRRMLIQFADFSGFFNKKQLELIKNLKLPTLPRYPRQSK